VLESSQGVKQIEDFIENNCKGLVGYYSEQSRILFDKKRHSEAVLYLDLNLNKNYK